MVSQTWVIVGIISRKSLLFYVLIVAEAVREFLCLPVLGKRFSELHPVVKIIKLALVLTLVEAVTLGWRKCEVPHVLEVKV